MKMSRHCPKYGCIVIYADCLECEDKICKRRKIENGNNKLFTKKLERSKNVNLSIETENISGELPEDAVTLENNKILRRREN